MNPLAKFPFPILTVDFETRWDRQNYTLSKMTTEAYIRDARFKAFGVCIHEYGTDKITQWYRHDELPRIFGMYDWSKTAVLAHNSAFDVGVLSMVYGVRPAFIFDSLSMARALRGVEAGNSLAKLAAAFALPPKGNAVYSTDGAVELSPEVERELADYCAHDVFLCEEIFTRLLAGLHGGGRVHTAYPISELKLIDMTLRMFTEPKLLLDVPMLEKARDEEEKKLQVALARCGVSEAELASNDQFAQVLERMGQLPPTKKKRPTIKTPNPVGMNFAFAKNDAHFQQMLNGDNEDVALLCEARLRVKSTLERTRAQRFIDIAARGALPVPLSYYGAETGRWQAMRGGSINFQNMKRGSFLRKSIMAPEGQVIIVGDLSQIEPRVLAWLAGYDVMLDTFRAGGDVYATFGSQMFGIPGLTKDTHPVERQSAKSALLGCFGSDTRVLTERGWVTLVDVTLEDRVWDGVEWAQHQGVLDQGEKDVLTAYGVSATADHEILTERGWRAWSEVLAWTTLFRSALSSAKGKVVPPVCTNISQPLKQKMQTYDIAQAGPRNRFTILTDAGPLIVHNCGYQLGWASFSAQLLVGFLGAPPLRYTKDEARMLGVTSADVRKFINNEWHMEKMMEIARTCTDEELLIHCLAAKAIVEKYRATAEPVVDLWHFMQERLVASLIEGEEYVYKGVLTFKKEEIVLVNGMSLKYPDIEIRKDERGRKEYWFGPEGKKQKLYAGRIVNNCVQALARIIMSDGMLRVGKRLPVVGTVHDELLALAPAEQGEAMKQWVHAQMVQVPAWMPGIPLNAEVGYANRYGLAK